MCAWLSARVAACKSEEAVREVWRSSSKSSLAAVSSARVVARADREAARSKCVESEVD